MTQFCPVLCPFEKKFVKLFSLSTTKMFDFIKFGNKKMLILKTTIRILMFCFCFTLFMNRAVLCFDRYYSKATNINMRVLRYVSLITGTTFEVRLISTLLSSNEVEFPEFTICTDYDHAYKNNFDISPTEMRNMNYPKHNNTAEFYKSMTYEKSEIVQAKSAPKKC